ARLDALIFVAGRDKQRYVRISISPADKELLIGSQTCGEVSGHRMRARRTQGRYSIEWREGLSASMVQDALKLLRRLSGGYMIACVLSVSLLITGSLQKI